MFTEETPGIFSVASRFVDGQNGIVLGERLALAIDGSNYEDEGQAMADFISNKGFEPNRMALTHGHGDHIWGGKPLAGGEVYGHHLTPEVMESQVARAAEKRGIAEDGVRAEMPWPTVTFKDELWMDLGGKTVWAFPTPGHSRDGMSIYVQEDHLLFAGDSVVNGIVSAIGDGDSRILQRSLNKLLTLDIEILVPGHGYALHGVDKVQDWLRWQIAYLISVRERVQKELAGGKGAEGVADAVDFETYIGDRLPIDRNQMPMRHRNTVDKIIEEEMTSHK